MLKVFLLFVSFFSLHAAHLNVGYSTDSFNELSKQDSRIVLELWFKKVVSDSNHTASLTFYDDVDTMSDDFSARKLDLVFANGFEFVKYFNLEELEGAFTGGAADQKDDNLVVVVNRETSPEILQKQKNLKIAHILGKNPAQLYVKNMALKEYKNRELTYIYTKKHNSSLLKLFFNQVDMAIVSKKTYKYAKELNPQIGHKLKIMHETDIPITSLGYYHKSVDKKIRQMIIKLSFKETSKKRGKQMMVMFKVDRLIKIDLARLDSIKKLYKEYLVLKAKKK